MEPILRAAALYFVVWFIMRLSGRRTFAELTTFDFVLLLIIGEATQQGLLGDDFSITNAALVVLTLVMIDIGLTYLKGRCPSVERVMDGLPLVIVDHGRALRDRMERARIDLDDVLEQARSRRGLERLDQIKYAVLERSGGISIIPYSSPPPSPPD